MPSEVPAFLTELVKDLYDDADRDYLSELVGGRWLAYAANTDVGQVVAWRTGAKQAPSDCQVAALGAALGLASQAVGRSRGRVSPVGVLPSPARGPGVERLDLARLSLWAEHLRASPIDLLRRAAGGTTAVTELEPSTDPVLDSLVVLALESWPALLLPPAPPGTPSDRVSLAWGAHRQEAHRQLLADPDIGALFPGTAREQLADDVTALASFLHWTDGSGASIQLVGLPEILVNEARQEATLRAVELTPATLIAFLGDAVNRLRRLARREPVEVPEFVVMGNLDLSALPSGDVNLEFGRLRGTRPEDAPQIPQALTPCATAILETAWMVRLHQVHPGEGIYPAEANTAKYRAAYQRAVQEDRQDNDQRMLLMRTALLLAQPDRERLLAPVIVATTRLGPLQTVRRLGFELAPGAVLPQQVLEPAAAEFAASWAKVLRRQHPSTLDLALRRLIAAAAGRHDPVDGFIDAVIAWEALFSGRFETTLRVTCSLAICCEPDNEGERLALQSEASTLYQARNDVVHGNVPAKESKRRNTYADRAAALEYALSALSWLHRARPELLLETVTASERSRRLLLLRPGNARPLDALEDGPTQ